MRRALFCLMAPVVLSLAPSPDASRADDAPPPEVASRAEFAGTWTLAIPMPDGVENPTLRIRESKGKLKGTLRGRRGSKRLRDFTFEDGSFSFNQVIEMPKGKLVMQFRGSVRGDRIQGVIELPMGILPFSGERKFD